MIDSGCAKEIQRITMGKKELGDRDNVQSTQKLEWLTQCDNVQMQRMDSAKGRGKMPSLSNYDIGESCFTFFGQPREPTTQS